MSRARAASLVGLGLSGCGWFGSDAEAGPGAALLPLPELSLALSCRPVVAQRGDCARDADCSDGLHCVADVGTTPADRSPLPLTCGRALGRGAARARCTAPADCASGLCALGDVCLRPCVADRDCPTGQSCLAVEARWGQGLQPVQACVRVFAYSADVRMAREPRREGLGTAAFGSVGSGAVQGTALMFLKPDCGVRAELQALRARDTGASVLFDLDALRKGQPTLNPVANSGGLLPVLVPNNPAVAVSGRGYDLTVRVDADSGAELVTVSRDGERATLDFNVFLLGGGEEVGATGLHPGTPQVRALMARLDARLRRIGMRVGIVREHDVPGALRDELGVIETRAITDSEGNLVDLAVDGIDALFELSAGLEDGGLNLFLVREMGDLLGISGGIPGAIGAHGTSMSGVAVAVDTVGLDALDGVIQHEMSHQLGLFHTSELDGFVVEPLSDTPACTVERDANADAVLSPSECRGRGSANLMFWAGSGSDLSAMQISILRRSPVLR